MALTTEQYYALMRIYDARQAECGRIHEKRYEEVISLIPEYKELEDKISRNALNFAADGIRRAANASELRKMLEETNKPLVEEKKRLLKLNGFPEDYLLPVYICPDCQDSGYIKSPDMPPRKCHCYLKLASELPFEGIQQAKIPKDADFMNFVYEYYSDEEIDETSGKTPRRNIEEITSYFKNYLEHYPDIYASHLIYGNVGVGKTHITYCIINELRKKSLPWVYLTAHEFYGLAEQNTFLEQNTVQKDNAKQRFGETLNADMLILDDLGSELCNAFTTSQLFLCINERQLKQKPTIITTNLSLADLKKNYGERIFSRLLDYTPIRISGDDIRYKKQIMNL